MTLTQQQRARIHDGLSPIVGDDAVEALLAEFPATDLDRPATEGFVRTEIAGVRTEIADLRTETRTEIAGVRTEIADLRAATRTEIAGLRTEVAGLRTEVADRLRSQTVWMTSVLIGGLGVATAIARLAG